PHLRTSLARRTRRRRAGTARAWRWREGDAPAVRRDGRERRDRVSRDREARERGVLSKARLRGRERVGPPRPPHLVHGARTGTEVDAFVRRWAGTASSAPTLGRCISRVGTVHE